MYFAHRIYVLLVFVIWCMIAISTVSVALDIDQQLQSLDVVGHKP
jgi:hypothetical protein